MMKSVFAISFLGLLMFGCKTVSIQQNLQSKTTNQVTLGSIGLHRDFVLLNDYQNTAIPEYPEPIKLSVSMTAFEKATYIAFENANVLQSQKVTVTYIDSLPNKPHFLHLKIADKVAILNALNAKQNMDVKSYLTNKYDAKLVSSISIAFSDTQMQAILNADNVFLAQNGKKSYELQLYKANSLLQSISFNEGVVFGYNTSGFCWQENDKYRLQLVDIVDGNRSCGAKTYKSAKTAKKNVNYYKL